MPRTNPQVVALERENKILRQWIDTMKAEVIDMPMTGCGDGSCIVAHPKGMHTNGGCRCDERRLRQAVQWWKRRAEFLQITIQEMRQGDGQTED